MCSMALLNVLVPVMKREDKLQKDEEKGVVVVIDWLGVASAHTSSEWPNPATATETETIK